MSSPETILYSSKLHEAYNATHKSLEKWKAYEAEFAMLKSTLKTLPDQVSRSVMVPIGKLAFMPGKLVHTNEITVLLGENWYAERSAAQAVGIVERREEFVRKNLSAIEKDLQILKEKVGLTPSLLPNEDAGVAVNEEGLPIMDIREDYPSDDEKSKVEISESPASPLPTQQNEIATPLPSAHGKTEAEIEEFNEMMRVFTEFEKEEECELFRQAEGDTSAEEEVGTDDEDEKDSDDERSEDGGEDGNDELSAEMEHIREKMRLMSNSLKAASGKSNTQDKLGSQSSIRSKGKGKEEIIEASEGEDEESETEDVIPQESGPKPVQPLLSASKHVSFAPLVPSEKQSGMPTIRSPADIFKQMAQSIYPTQDDESVGDASDDEKILGYVNWKDAMVTPQMDMPGRPSPPEGTDSPDDPQEESGEDIVGTVRERDHEKQEPTLPARSNPSVMSFNIVEKENVKYADESDMEDDMLMREVAVEYQKRRQNFIASQGGYSDEAMNAHAENEYSTQAEGEEEEPPKRISRFKAARLGFKPT